MITKENYAIVLALVIGFMAGAYYMHTEHKQEKRDLQIQYLMQQLPNLKNYFGS
jgi:hypothetical protein